LLNLWQKGTVDWMGEDMPVQDSETAQAGALTLEEVSSRLKWLIELRWLAAAGVVMLPLAAANVLAFRLPVSSLALVGVGIAAYNLAFRSWLRARYRQMTLRLAAVMANTQIAVDLAALTIVLHLSGGVDNPLNSYYVFHVMIAATILSPLAAYAQATWALVLYLAMVSAEAIGWLPHYSIAPLRSEELYRSPHAYLIVLALASLLYVAAYLTCSVVQRLRQRERQLEQMSQEAQTTATQCQVAYDKLLALQHAQVLYMRRVAHELKSPLAAIATALSVILEGLTGDVPPKQRQMIERTYRRTQDAIALLGDLFDLARMRELPPQEFQAVDVDHVAETVVGEYAEQAATRRIHLALETTGRLPAVLGNDEALTTMLGNLVSNGVKYTGEGGRVVVGLSAEGSDVVIRVSDNGPGIAQDDLARIFDEFYRAPDARQSDIEGTGLGLAIVKSIVEQHGGTITVESEVGRGTTFIVRLPAMEAREENAGPANDAVGNR
jgi:signal transduction histidine kinase